MQLRCAFVAINAHYAHTSLALRQLRAHAPECAYFEFHLNQPFRTMADALIEYAPALVGLSCYIWNVDMALRLARALKAALPGVVIAAGGPRSSATPPPTCARIPSWTTYWKARASAYGPG